MVFDSYAFAIFFVVVYGLYLVLPHKKQNLLLLISSYFFYGFWSWKFLLLLMATNVLDYWCAIGIENTNRQRLKRLFVTATIAANMGALAFFKYFNFFAENLQRVFGAMGIGLETRTLEIILPFGISFYTFQEMMYVLDVYRGRVKASRKFTDFALFVTYFPQLVAGPIMRADKLLPQVENPRTITRAGLSEGGWLIYWGLFKKIFVADNLALLVDPVYANPGAHSGPQIALATYAFAFQIYCDFSGYSDMARGLGKLMGFDIMWNFNLPYFSANPPEFWRRWHISLSEFLRDNLYIPLGGNREGRGAEMRNLMITMALGGLWHGARWNFVAWGIYQGVLLVGHRLWRMSRGNVSRGVEARSRFAPERILSIVIMFNLVCVGWLLFRAERAYDIPLLLRGLLQGWEQMAAVVPMAKQLVGYMGIVAVMEVAQYVTRDRLLISRAPVLVRAAIYFLLYLCMVLGAADDDRVFIYFQF